MGPILRQYISRRLAKHSSLEDDFFGTELHSPYDVHFLKADGIWNAIVRLKRQVVESVYYINFQKTDLCIKPDASINIFFKIDVHSHIPRHRFKKINPKIF